ncbi:MAG: hypothetical protein WDM96_11265 [Lacunisphaera sp.]
MKTTVFRILGTLLLAGLAVIARAADDDVSAPSKRAEAIAQAKALLAAKDTPASVRDPLHSEAFVEALGAAGPKAALGQTVTQAAPAGPRSNRDLLQAIALNLKTSGYFVLGGEPTLVFGQKRVKAGGVLTIHFEGADYTLEIVSIERPNFTLRLNREEFTRPIK